jgi:hypothetical protein
MDFKKEYDRIMDTARRGNCVYSTCCVIKDQGGEE